MKKTLKLPFTIDLKGGNKKSFKLLSEGGINKKMKKNTSILNFIKQLVHINSTKNNKNTDNKINYVKASSTSTYYKKIKK